MIVEDESSDTLFDIAPLIPLVTVERGGAPALPYAAYMEWMQKKRAPTKNELQVPLSWPVRSSDGHFSGHVHLRVQPINSEPSSGAQKFIGNTAKSKEV